MRILITGANGQLGHDVQAALASHTLFPSDCDSLDITDAAAVASSLDRLRPEALVNCAAYTAVDAAESDEPRAFALNALGPELLARACAARSIRFIHISTDYVFSGDHPIPSPWLESDVPAPCTAYGRTKFAGEQRVLSACPSAVILRTAWLYGEHGKNFPKTMLRLALQNPESSARVVCDQWGCPTYSARLADQIRVILESPSVPLSGVCHCVGLGHTNWHCFAETFLSFLGLPHHFTPCSSADFPTPAKRPSNSILENRKLATAGLLVMKDWKEDLATFAAKIKTQAKA